MLFQSTTFFMTCKLYKNYSPFGLTQQTNFLSIHLTTNNPKKNYSPSWIKCFKAHHFSWHTNLKKTKTIPPLDWHSRPTSFQFISPLTTHKKLTPLKIEKLKRKAAKLLKVICLSFIITTTTTTKKKLKTIPP
jgi:hypothetical protein